MRKYRKALALAGVAVWLAWPAMAAAPLEMSDAPAVSPSGTTAVASLPENVAAVLKLAQAKVSDDTIMAYIKNSRSSYGLNADQIIYLRQQGLSDALITAMLNQPRPGNAPATVPIPSSPAPELVPSIAYEQPPETVAESQPYYDYGPYYSPYYYPYYYPAYGGYYYWPWPVVGAYGWGGYWHGYRGFAGGFHGGFRYGGGFHGYAGVFHGGGGGFHGNGHGGRR